MKKLIDYINKLSDTVYSLFSLPKDKQEHIIVGLIIFLILGIILGMELSLIWIFIIAICKELYDYFHPESHSCEVMDIVATTAIPTAIFLLDYLVNI